MADTEVMWHRSSPVCFPRLQFRYLGEEIKTAHLVEAVLLNCVMLFAKNPGELNTELSITVNGEGEFDYYIAGVAS